MHDWVSPRQIASRHSALLAAFHRVLAENGFVEGRNVAIEASTERSEVSALGLVGLTSTATRAAEGPAHGSSPMVNRTGIIVVDLAAAKAEGVVGATIIATLRRTKSAASSGSRSF
jgi:hypothetical protein